jgi:hypothetical protein
MLPYEVMRVCGLRMGLNMDSDWSVSCAVTWVSFNLAFASISLALIAPLYALTRQAPFFRFVTDSTQPLN